MPDSAKDEIYLQSALVVVAAHQDDEVIGMSAQLGRLGRFSSLIHITNGAPRNLFFAERAGFATREAYAEARHAELLKAVAYAGVSPSQTFTLDVADQDAALHLVPIARKLQDMLRQLQPKFVFTHPYEGGHPDHDACAFAVRAAIIALEQEEGMAPPALMEFTSYFLRDGRHTPFEFLPNSDEPIHTTTLTDAERTRKQQMYDCYQTQQRVLVKFPIGIERHRNAPVYDFTQRPHEGQLYYETFASGMTPERWQELAGKATEELASQGVRWASPS